MSGSFSVKPKRRKSKKAKPRDENTYREKLQNTNKWQKEIVSAGQEIGDLPPVVDAKRKKNCRYNLEAFCTTYFPEAFNLKFSPTHLRVIEQLQATATQGGQYALAMPRASGKTTIMQAAALWTILYGHRSFVVIIASSANRGLELMEDVKVWFETNEMLFADFPEVCYPIRRLERITHRQRGQKYQGKPTRIEWAGHRLALPTIESSLASGSIMSASGMTGADIRGQKALMPDGSIIRPDFVLIDDPQTRESAASPMQCSKRESIISGDVLGMAGPGQTISAFCTCTVISQGDLADRLLDRKLHPEWHGERQKMLISEPKHMQMWEDYAELYRNELRNDGSGKQATAFYKANREKMDEGAEVYWDERFEKWQASALQNAMTLKLISPVTFASEYQNEPESDDESEAMLTADEIMKKVNKINKNVVAADVEHITAFIDIQKEVLFYTVVGWADDFTGFVLDYGNHPEQRKKNINLDNLSATISSKYKGGFEAGLNAALNDLVNRLATTRYATEQKQEMSIKLCLIDANWGESTDIVYNVCQRSEHANIIMPAHGVFVGATNKPFSEYKKKRGERLGQHWRIPSTVGKRAVRHVLNDVNYWKTFIHSRLALEVGDKGSLSFYGKKPATHRTIAEHLTAEYKVAVTAKGRTIVEWKQRANQKRNDWFDCLVGAACAASICGAALPGAESGVRRKKKKKISLAELQRKRGVV